MAVSLFRWRGEILGVAGTIGLHDVCSQLVSWIQVTDDGSVVNITSNAFQNLTQPDWVASWNTLADKNTVKAGTYLDIPVNCSCGNPSVSSDYGLFLTYPVVTGTGSNLSGIASDFNTSVDLVKRFNPGIVWDNAQPTQYAFIPIPGISFSVTDYESSFLIVEKLGMQFSLCWADSHPLFYVIMQNVK